MKNTVFFFSILFVILSFSPAHAEKVCPIDGEVFPDTYNFCTKHGVELESKSDKPSKIHIITRDGKTEAMKFTGFNTKCDGYGDDGIKLIHEGVKFTIPWKDIKYILPEHNKAVLKSGKSFETKSVKPSSCASAYVAETKAKKVKFLDYEEIKEINIKIGIKDIEVIAFSDKGLKEGKRKIEAIEEAEEKKRAANMAYVKGGCYEMGCGSWTSDCDSDEQPAHEVCVDDFYMDKYEVTQKEYKKVMGENPARFKGENNPVEKVNWNEANNYCRKTGKRLPTEAEWEYAARSGGKKEKYSGSNNVDSVAWYSSNSGSETHPVGQKQPNGLGLYDMSGNVWEWVADWYDSGYYKSSIKNNPKGPSSGGNRVLRGGSWGSNPGFMRAAFRSRGSPDIRSNVDGFRCARTP